MGLFDKMKQKAQGAIGQVVAQQAHQQAPHAPHAPHAQAEQHMGSDPASESQAPASGLSFRSSTPATENMQWTPFQWNGDTYAMPYGWDGLSIDDWFYKYEKLRDRQMHIDDEQGLQTIEDHDGEPLDPEEVLLIQEYGFRGGGDFEAYRNMMVSYWASQTGENFTDCMFRMSGIARERIMADKAGAMSGAGGQLEPVEGVSVEQWAQLQAQLAGGADLNALLASAGIDAPRWERVSAEWMARMSTDTTMTVVTVYGNAFASGGAGQFGQQAAQAAAQGVGGDVGAEPVPFEQYVQIMEAQSAGAQRGEDANAVLASFGMNALDWSNCGTYWSKKMQQEASKYHELFTKYSAKYQGMYGTGDGLTIEERKQEIIGTVLEMARAGRAGEITNYLQDRLPEDANDFDALDWYYDKCCDICAEQGDRNTAQQLLWARFPLQSDQSEGFEAYIAQGLESLF